MFGDGTELYKSAEITDVNTTEEIDVSVEGYKSLVLRCTPTSGRRPAAAAHGRGAPTFEGEISENAGKPTFGKPFADGRSHLLPRRGTGL